MPPELPMPDIARPAADESAPFYHRYIDRVPDGDVRRLLDAQLVETAALLDGLSDERAGFRYAPGKWSVREVVGHITDTERIMAYRVLRIARGDTTPLPGFDENLFVARAGFDARDLAGLVDEFALVRRSTLALLDGLPAEAFVRRGEASGAPASVRALVYIIAGHELHHRALLRERYGLGSPSSAA